MQKNVAAILLAGALLAAQFASAEDKIADVTDMQALRNAVRTDKKAFVASTLQLTPAEAKKFWPLYDEYQRSLDMTNRRRVVAIQQLAVGDAPESEIYAKRLVNELIAVDEAEVKARRDTAKPPDEECAVAGSCRRKKRRAICNSNPKSARPRLTTWRRPFR